LAAHRDDLQPALRHNDAKIICEPGPVRSANDRERPHHQDEDTAMTKLNLSPASGRIPVRTALVLFLGLGLATSALASELTPPSGKFKSLRDHGDVTVIIINKNDRRSTSRIGAPSRSQSIPAAPSSRFVRDDDDVTIRVRRNHTSGSGHGTVKQSGPKVIIVDRNTGRCSGGGVCVIRP
jgi:hypothetical protein